MGVTRLIIAPARDEPSGTDWTAPVLTWRPKCLKPFAIYAAVSDVVRPPGGIGGSAPIGNATLDPVQGGGLTALSLDDGRKFSQEQ